MPIWVIIVDLATVGAVLLLTAVLWRVDAPTARRGRSEARDGGMPYFEVGGGGRGGRDNDRDSADDAGDGGGGDGGGGD